MKIAIYGSRRQHDNLAAIRAFLKAAAREGVGLVFHRKLFRHLQEEMPADMAALRCEVVDEFEGRSADFAISLGGDGTFLRTAAWVGAREIPIVGVNTGHLGYLAALDIADLPALPSALAGAEEIFRVEPRSLIEVSCPSLEHHRVWPFALNEVALTKEETASMIVADTWLGSEHLAEYRADGILFSTPTGSTAYSLSVGGPLVEPELDVHIIAPIAAHSLSMRPLVVGGGRPLRVIPGGRAPHMRLSIDGRSLRVENGEEITLRRAPFRTIVLQRKDRSFSDTLRLKLHWGEE